MALTKQRFKRSSRIGSVEKVRPVFDDFHLLQMNRDYEYPRHQHANYEAIVVQRGPYRCELNDRELAVRAGQALIIKPGDWHMDHLRKGMRHYVVHFRLPAGPAALPGAAMFRDDCAPGQQICSGDYRRDGWYLRELRRESEAGAAHAAAVQDALLSVLFWKLVRGLDPGALTPEFRRLPADETRRGVVSAVFARHLGDNPNVSVLAKELNVSPRQLSHECRKLFGTSPARQLLRLKIDHAEDLLRYRQMRVKEVSEAVGFETPYHFSAAFRRVRGLPPSQFRRT